MRLWSIASFISLAFLAGCVLPGNVVVDLPDDEGNVGRVSVSNAAGETELTRPLAAVGLEPAAAPGRPFITDQQAVNTVFGKVLEATPRKPVAFVLYFEPGSTRVAFGSYPDLTRAVDVAKTTDHPEISVISHSDAAGLGDQNDALMLARAQTIAAHLKNAGISPSVIDVENYGAALPLAARFGLPQQQNGRIEIIIR